MGAVFLVEIVEIRRGELLSIFRHYLSGGRKAATASENVAGFTGTNSGRSGKTLTSIK